MNALTLVDQLRVEAVQSIASENGLLLVGEVGKHLGIPVQRFFAVTGVPAGDCRGHHAHRALTQVLVLLQGEVTVVCDDGTTRRTFVLSQAGDKLEIPPGVWAEQIYRDSTTTLLVLCDAVYDEADYLRDYQDFLAWRQEQAR